jgi:D-lactate dehydrogenase (cytochrome)
LIVANRDRTGVYKITPDPAGMKVVYGEEKILKNYPDYLRDESNTLGSDVEALFFPNSIENISYAVTEAIKNRKTLTISGGRTGICGGAVPCGGYLISLEKMTKILNLQKQRGEYELTVQSGIRLDELVQVLQKKELGIEGEATEEFSDGKKSFFHPPDPTETSATLGGTVATNASGARTFYYGPTRDYVTGIEVVLPSGELLKVVRGAVREMDGMFTLKKDRGTPLVIPAPSYVMPDTKNTTGLYSKKSMDLIDLFIGSEGILGIIATVTLRLIEEPPGIFSAAAFFSSEKDALHFVIEARRQQKPLALEYFDADSLQLLTEQRQQQGPLSEIPEIPESAACVYFEFSCRDEEGLSTGVLRWSTLIRDCGGDHSGSWGALTKRDQGRLKTFRHSLPESINKIIAHNKLADSRIHKVGTDMAVPDNRLEEMMAFYRTVLRGEKIRHVIFGHIGNNHLHVNMIPSSYEELRRAKELYHGFALKAVNLGGSVSAEHGIGKLKRDFVKIQYPEKAIEEMQNIKAAFDPDRVFNPGNVI